jgi:hypothetical protein
VVQSSFIFYRNEQIPNLQNNKTTVFSLALYLLFGRAGFRNPHAQLCCGGLGSAIATPKPLVKSLLRDFFLGAGWGGGA